MVDFTSDNETNEIILLVENVAGVKLSPEERTLFANMLRNLATSDPTRIAVAIKQEITKIAKKTLNELESSAIDNGIRSKRELIRSRRNKWELLREEAAMNEVALKVPAKSPEKQPVLPVVEAKPVEMTKETATVIIAKAEEKLSLPLDKIKRESAVNNFLKGLKAGQSPVDLANMALIGVANAAFTGCIQPVILQGWINAYGIADYNREQSLTVVDQSDRNAMRDAVLKVLHDREIDPRFADEMRKQSGAPELDSGSTGSGKSSAPTPKPYRLPSEATSPFGVTSGGGDVD